MKPLQKKISRGRGTAAISQLIPVIFALGMCLLGVGQLMAAPPSNDSFANAIQLSGTFDSAVGTTEDATRQSGETSTTGYFTVWYKWTAPETGRARFSALAADNDFESQRITIWTGTSLGNLVFLGLDQQYTREATIVDLPVKAGTPIYFCVSHRGNNAWDQGAFECAVVLSTNTDLNSRNVVSYSTTNGRFNNATTLAGDDVTAISYSMEFPEREAGEPQINPNYSSWWKYTAVEDGRVTVSNAGSEVGGYYDQYTDQTLLIYQVDTYAEMINAAPIAGATTSGGNPNPVSFDVVAGETYYIVSGVGRIYYGNFREGDDPYDLGWRVMTLQYTPPPPPEPEIDLVAPGRRVGRSFTARAVITNPEYAERVIWKINGKPRLMNTNGESTVTKRFRGKKQRKRRGKRIRMKRAVVSVAVYEPGAGFASDSDVKSTRSKFYKFR